MGPTAGTKTWQKQANLLEQTMKITRTEGDLPVSSRRKTCTASKSEEVLAIESVFGPPPILPGEDTSAYEALLARVSADVKPADIIEKIWVRDIVDPTWEIFRLRRIKMGLVSRSLRRALSEYLEGYEHEHPKYPQ